MTKYDNRSDSGSAWSAFVFSAAFTWMLFYTFEVFLPYIEEAERYEQKCVQLGGFASKETNTEKTCIKKDIIIEVK